MIGECQLCLGQNADAMQNFKKSLKAIKERLKTNNGDLDLRECQKTMNAIATVYMRRGYYSEVTPWILAQDSLYEQALKLPKADPVYQLYPRHAGTCFGTYRLCREGICRILIYSHFETARQPD